MKSFTRSHNSSVSSHDLIPLPSIFFIPPLSALPYLRISSYFYPAGNWRSWPRRGDHIFAEGGTYKEVSGILGTQNWSNALTSARNYRRGGYSDWRLPTKDELNLIYQNLRARNIGNLGDNWHWSSSEATSSYAWVQNFSDGRQDYSTKSSTGSVRAIRAF
jgi:hypothetical protein